MAGAAPQQVTLASPKLRFLLRQKLIAKDNEVAVRHCTSNAETKRRPGLPPLRGALCCSSGQAAAELALRAQT